MMTLKEHAGVSSVLFVTPQFSFIHVESVIVVFYCSCSVILGCVTRNNCMNLSVKGESVTFLNNIPYSVW